MCELLGLGGRVKYLLQVPTPTWLCYELALEKWQRLDLFNFRKRGIKDIIKLFKDYLSSPDRLLSPKNAKLDFGEPQGELLAIVTSVNQNKVLEKLLSPACKKIAIFPEPFADYSLLDSVPMRQIEFFGIKYVPFIILEFLVTTSRYKKRSIFYFFREYVQAYGIYRLLQEHPFFRGKTIVYSNDHSPLTRVIGLVQGRAYKAVYVPHANVSSDFPPLEMDVAFLYGEHMMSKYCVNGANIVLIGNPLFDGVKSYPSNEVLSRSHIGICVNLLDNTELVINLIKSLTLRGTSILFRAHPSDKRDWPVLLSEFENIDYSDAKINSVEKFLEEVKVVFSGPSSVLIDAWGAGVHSFQVSTSDKLLIDNYGLIGDGYVRMLNSAEEVHNVLENLEKIYFETDPRKLGGFFFENCKAANFLSKSIFQKHLEVLGCEKF